MVTMWPHGVRQELKSTPRRGKSSERWPHGKGTLLQGEAGFVPLPVYATRSFVIHLFRSVCPHEPGPVLRTVKEDDLR
jgi:hypothetical protein